MVAGGIGCKVIAYTVGTGGVGGGGGVVSGFYWRVLRLYSVTSILFAKNYTSTPILFFLHLGLNFRK